MLMTDRLQKSNRTNLTDTRNVTFSQALEAGLTHYDYLDGRKTGRSGREAALASHSVSPAKAKELKTNDTFGPLFDGLSPKNDLQQSLENRLRQAMAVNGCQEYVLTWKRWDMKSGPPICALRASGRRISGKGYSGWPTPNTPNGGRATPPGTSTTGKTPDGKKRQVDLQHVAAIYNGLGITNAEDHTRGVKAQGKRTQPKPACFWSNSIPSPAPMESGEGCLAGWPISTSKGLEGTTAVLQGRVAEDLPGIVQKNTILKLNPYFSLWLMGYPIEWGRCAGLATP
jgi:hypothetical protein